MKFGRFRRHAAAGTYFSLQRSVCLVHVIVDRGRALPLPAARWLPCRPPRGACAALQCPPALRSAPSVLLPARSLAFSCESESHFSHVVSSASAFSAMPVAALNTLFRPLRPFAKHKNIATTYPFPRSRPILCWSSHVTSLCLTRRVCCSQ